MSTALQRPRTPQQIRDMVTTIMDRNRRWPGWTMTQGATEQEPPQGGTGQQGTAGGQQQGGSLFDNPPAGGQQQVPDGQQSGTQGGGQQAGGQGFVMTPEIQSVIAAEANRIADRRINQITQGRGQQGGGDQNGGQGNQGGGQQQDHGSGQQTGGQQDRGNSGSRQGVESGALREARLVFREYVSDEITFLGNEERDLGRQIASSTLPTLLAQGMDVDEAGRQAARLVGETLRTARTFYQGQTIRALQSRGALPQDFTVQPPQAGQQGGGAGGYRPGGQTATQGQQGWDRGAAVAAALFPDRQPAQQTQ